jgi:asparagine synthase (glutamine-hydrolysing)
MCGIFGVFSKSPSEIKITDLKKMGGTIHHRGPDDQGIFVGQFAGIGNQRLSIIDLDGGHQPFISSDGKIAVVQNGEIFNHVELALELAQRGNPCITNSDTEVLLRLYQLDGIDFVKKLNGMFAISIYDENSRSLFLIRDRVGVKPLFFHEEGNKISFASEIKAMLSISKTKPLVNFEAIHHFLTFNYVPQPMTMFDGIKHVMPGEIVTITADGMSSKKWWDLADMEPDHTKSESDWSECFLDILSDAVRLRLRSDVPFGAFLSGGVDSSSVVAFMATHLKEPVKTFCIGFDDPLYDESVFAKEASDLFKTNHLMERVKSDMLDLWPKAIFHCDQPHGDLSFLPTYAVSKLASRSVKVVLTGDGGDELFAGYDKYKNFFVDYNSEWNTPSNFHKTYFDSISLFSDSQKREMYTDIMMNKVGDLNSFSLVKPYFERVAHQDPLNQALYIDMQFLLPGNNLVKPDRMGMAASIEARTPFLDYRMMEMAFKIPGFLKLKNNETKYIYKKSVENLIGHRLTYRSKQMFTVPVGNWFKKERYKFAKENLLGLSKYQLFSESYLCHLLKMHVEGASNNTRELRALISLNLWFEYYSS